MNNISDQVEQDLPELCQFGNKLLVLAEEVLANAKYSEDDHLGFMSLCFLSKQTGHMQSILTLSPSRDAILIARSMIEGLCQLLWAAVEPERSLNWRAFALVHDLRVLESKEAQGETLSLARQDIESKLSEYGEPFLNKKGKTLDKNRPLMSKHYHYNWRCDKRIRDICDTVGGTDLYNKLYEQFSDWHHWGVAGLGSAIEQHADGVVYYTLSSSDSASALACGFQCLLQTMEITDKRLCTGVESKIYEINNEYIARYQHR